MLDREPANRLISEGLRDLGKADGIEFVHNALRGFLAARRFADEEAVEDPIRAALELDEWDIPVLAAAKGTRGYRDKLIRALLGRARRSDAATARRLRMTALRCAETGELASELRERSSGLSNRVCSRRALRLKPPGSPTSAGVSSRTSPRGRISTTKPPPPACAALP